MATLTSKNLFVGYSTVNRTTKQQLVDIKLVEQDLLNHFNTRIGERVMMPTFGCGIWDYLMDPFDDTTKDNIIYEATQVINFDSRVKLNDIIVTEFEYGIRIKMNLLYVPFQAISNFSVDFDRRGQSL